MSTIVEQLEQRFAHLQSADHSDWVSSGMAPWPSQEAMGRLKDLVIQVATRLPDLKRPGIFPIGTESGVQAEYSLDHGWDLEIRCYSNGSIQADSVHPSRDEIKVCKDPTNMESLLAFILSLNN